MFSRELILISLQIVNNFLFIFEASQITEIVLVSVNIFISCLHQVFVYKRIGFYYSFSKMMLIIQSILAFSIIISPHFQIVEAFLQVSLQFCIIGKSKNTQYDFITYVTSILLIGVLNQLQFESTATQIIRFIVILIGLIFLFVFFIKKQKEVQTILYDQYDQEYEQMPIQQNIIENQYSIQYDTNLQLLNMSDQLKTQIDPDFLQNCIIMQYEPKTPFLCQLPRDIPLKEMLQIIIEQNYEIHLSVLKYNHPICEDYSLNINYNLAKIQLDLLPKKERDSILMNKQLKTILSQIFSTFSHEFGTALNYISAFSQIGCDCGNTETFREIHNVCQIMHHFVLNLIDFNDIQSEKFSLKVQPIEISQLLEDIRRLFQKQLFNKGLKLDCYNFTSIQSIVSDRRRILQILIQIIQNAQKFTLHGGVKVIISQVKENLIQFSVEDTGIGINNQVKLELKQLFQSHIKSSNKISENTAGFGLGCYLSNLIAHQLSDLSYSEGGGLQIEQLESGTRISFVVKNTELPLYISNSSSIQKISNHLFYDNRQNQISSQIKINLNSLLSQYKKSSLTKQRVSLLEANLQHQQIMSLVINDESDETDYFKRIKYFCNAKNLKLSGTPLSLRDLQFSDKYMNNCNCILVLIVDDEMINIIALQLMLKSLDIQSDFCFNGQEALSKIENNRNAHCKYSVVFMDINMPVMDGFKTTQLIRQNHKHIIDIIACTAFSDAETQIKCQQYGMNHYLNKPVNLNQLFYLMEVLKL